MLENLDFGLHAVGATSMIENVMLVLAKKLCYIGIVESARCNGVVRIVS